MADRTFLDWPFFGDEHRQLAGELEIWCEAELGHGHGDDIDSECRTLVRKLGEGGWLRYCVPAAWGGRHEALDVRSLALIRETLARHDGLADFVFAMQGLGSGTISLFGSEVQKQSYLPGVAKGEKIAAFALTEPTSGSDVASLETRASPDGNGYVVDGAKTYISNGGIADFYVVFCRLGDAEREFIALVVEPTDAGFSVSSRIETMSPHPLATIRFDNCRVAADRVVGEPGRGLRVALATLDVFRTTVGAAALGLARRALDEALAYSSSRMLFGKPLSDQQLTQAKLARMATDIDASALLIYRSAWTCDVDRAPLHGRSPREALGIQWEPWWRRD